MIRTNRALFVGLGLMAVSALGETLSAGRPIDTDPANFVEGPFTLEPGRSQIEWGAFAYGRDQVENFFVENHTVSAMVLRTALTASAEIQLFYDGWISERVQDRSTGSRDVAAGLGDTALQLKYNVMGNDDGLYAIGATLFTVFDTGQRNIGLGETVSGGSLVFAATLFEGQSSSFQAHSQLKYYHGKSAKYLEFSHSFTWGVAIDDRNSLAVEANAHRTDEHAWKWALLSSVTFTHAFNDSLALDIAATVGLNREAEDVGCFFVLTRWL